MGTLPKEGVSFAVLEVVVAFTPGSGGQSPTWAGVVEIVVPGREEAATFALMAEG